MKGWLGTLGSWADLTDANGVSAVYSGGSESTDYNNSGLTDAYHLQGSKSPYHLGCTNWRRTRVFKIS